MTGRSNFFYPQPLPRTYASAKCNTTSFKAIVSSSFEYTASQIFNSLPQQRRSITICIEISSQAKKFLKDKALTHILEISNEN